MTKKDSGDNSATGIWAPLTNLTIASNALERAMNRRANLPGAVTFSGPSGFGKTMSAAYCATKHNAVYVECRSFYTAKALLAAILKEAGILPERTLADMLEQIVAELQLSRRPLIVDEVDHIVEGKALQLIRDIHDASGCAVMLIGEERLPKKLESVERFHNRVLEWQLAMPASKGDARALAGFYCREAEIEDDLLKRIHERSRAVVRRMCVNIDAVREFAATHGLKKVGLADWGERAFYTGDAPARRPV